MALSLCLKHSNFLRVDHTRSEGGGTTTESPGKGVFETERVKADN